MDSTFEAGAKKKKIRPSIIGQVLTAWGRLLQRLWFGFLGSALPRLWVRVLLHRSGHYPLAHLVSPLLRLMDIKVGSGISLASTT